MKINNPRKIKPFPFNIDSQIKTDLVIKELDGLGWKKILPKGKLYKKFPVRFTCISKENKLYMIY